MKTRLHFLSFILLSLLFGFVLGIVYAISLVTGSLTWQIMIMFTVILNFLFWLINPYISDLIYKFFYKIKFSNIEDYDVKELENYKYLIFIKKVCSKHNLKVPKIGIIKDKNPTAFCYGSASFNARIILTEGLFTFLNEKELEAVVAHELGHIVNKDFIIMSLASTFLQILYEIYVIFSGSRRIKSEDSKGKGSYLVVVGFISLLLYFIGTYILLFLSRIREYYADDFSAKEVGDSNLLSSALIKIGYGIAIVPDTVKTSHLLNNTRSLGIFDFKSSKNIGLIYLNGKNDKSFLEKALLFDIVNPWAKLLEFKSTHPLIGKRIKKLCSLTSSPMFNFDSIINNSNIDKKRLWGNFFKDILVNNLILFTFIILYLVIFLEIFLKLDYYLITLVIGTILLIFFSIIKIRYKYPKKEFVETNILNCMSDIYASPIRGKQVKLRGEAIGRGEAGFIFSEDMIFQDNSGIIYLNYESNIPLFGNLFFSWKKLKKLFRKTATSTGWFLRGNTHHLELFQFKTSDEVINSYVRFWLIFGYVFNIVLFESILILILFLMRINLF